MRSDLPEDLRKEIDKVLSDLSRYALIIDESSNGILFDKMFRAWVSIELYEEDHYDFMELLKQKGIQIVSDESEIPDPNPEARNLVYVWNEAKQEFILTPAQGSKTKGLN